jgi:hypothetical protein
MWGESASASAASPLRPAVRRAQRGDGGGDPSSAGATAPARAGGCAADCTARQLPEPIPEPMPESSGGSALVAVAPAPEPMLAQAGNDGGRGCGGEPPADSGIGSGICSGIGSGIGSGWSDDELEMEQIARTALLPTSAATGAAVSSSNSAGCIARAVAAAPESERRPQPTVLAGGCSSQPVESVSGVSDRPRATADPAGRCEDERSSDGADGWDEWA